MSASQLVLGTVQMGLNYGVANESGQLGPEESGRILNYAQSQGIDCLDTAASYGDSEATLGALGVQDWRVISKLAELPDDIADVDDWVAREVDGSLQRLGVQRIYGLLLHRPLQLLGPQGDRLYSALTRLKDQGVVEKIGASVYGPDELDLLIPRFALDLVQAPYNLLDRRLLHSGWLDHCQAQNVEMHVRSVFLQGALLMDPDKRAQRFGKWAALWKDYEQWLHEQQIDPVAACLGFALAEPRINGVVVGVDGLAQLQELVSVANRPVPDTIPDISTDDTNLINPSKWESP